MRLFMHALVVLALFALSGVSLESEATAKRGFLKIRENQRLYIEYRAAKNGAPTLIFLNGLTWDTRDWLEFVEAFTQFSSDTGILLYDMEGQGRTLLDKAPVTFKIPIENQVRDLHDLIQSIEFTGPRILVGLSYGGAVGIRFAATYPKDFDQLILLAPFLHRLPDQDIFLNTAVRNHKLMYPFDPRSEDELYDYYLRGLIYATYPQAEPILLENPFKLEAAFRMVQGAKQFMAQDLVNKLGGKRVHLMGGEDDPFVRDLELQALWAKIKGGGSYLRLKSTAHKISQIHPKLSARWVNLILSKDERLYRGNIFEIDPVEKIARSGPIEIPVEGSCALRLKKPKI